MSVRVRFAPSPTGYLHVGNARAALYNWVFARGRDGVFVLRGDDTDAGRSTGEYQEDILDGLRWLGLDWDEGLERGGPHATYRQSERFDRYRQIAEKLVADGRAYHSFETPDQLEAFRSNAQADGRSPAYDGSLRLEQAEVGRRLTAGERAPIRFAVTRPGVTEFEDIVRGAVTFDHAQVDDFVILRSDGSPTYHLASTVDDVDFGITHVVRGEDLLSSTPKHIQLAQALGAELPIYAHLPLLLGPDGKKLSKRHGDTLLRAFRNGGILAEAMVNYLALLGWSPGDDETVVSLTDMVDRFDLADVTKAAAIFDTEKLEWLNGVYIRALSTEDFVAKVRPLVVADLEHELTPDDDRRLAAIAPHVQERARRLTEVAGQVRFLFTDIEVDGQSWHKVMAQPDARQAMAEASRVLDAIGSWDVDTVEKSLRSMLDRTGLSSRKGLQPVRVAVSGSSVSPPLFESIAVLGREVTLERMGKAASRMDAEADPQAF